MNVWFNDPMELFRTDKIAQFWPTMSQTPNERINATTRFIIYATCIVYLIKRDARVFVLAALVLAVMYFLYKGGLVKSSAYTLPVDFVGLAYPNVCQAPSVDNPMGNVLLSDYVTKPNRPPACDYNTVKPMVSRLLDNTFQFDAGRSRDPDPDVQQRFAGRQWVTLPPTTIPSDQTGFAEWCYGAKFSPICRDDQSKCDPNMRGAQLEALAGLDMSGAPRVS